MENVKEMQKQMSESELEGFNYMIEMALTIRQQINIRKSFLNEGT